MKRLIIIISLQLFFCILLTAQDIKPGGKVEVGMPSVLKGNDEGTYKLTDIEKEICKANKWGQNKKISKKYWRVWSDRDNNIVYDKAGKETARKLNFGDQVIIANINDNMALVYKDDISDSEWPKISNHPRQIGWVKMDHLLLWDRCPTNDCYVQKKAVIATHINDIDKKVYNYRFTSPIGENGMQALTMDMNFYFIMKKEGERALLCINPSVDRGGGNLFGWVDKGFYVEWEQRACLEANWDPDYVEHWKNKEVCVYAGTNYNSGSRLTYKFGRENGDRVSAYKYRWNPNFLRFPILEPIRDNTEWAYCTAFADPKTGKIGEYDGKSVDSLTIIRKEKRQMNIIYVIEATNDMGEYLDAVKQSLGKLKDYSEALTVKTGAVLYRNNTSGNLALEMTKLDEPDDNSFLSLLTASKANGKLMGKKRTVALRQAIETATNPTKMGFSKEQSTLIIIIGNRGDEKDLADETILKELKRNHIQIMSIQVVNSEAQSSAAYEDQIKDMIIKNITSQYNAIGAEEISRKTVANDGYRFSSSKKEDGIFFSCVLYPPNVGDKYSGSDVTKLVNNGVRWFSQTIYKWSERFEKEISETGDSNNYSKFLVEFLGPELYNRIKKIGGIHAFDGYVPMKDNEGGNYWHYIIYMSRDEFAQLLHNLKETYEAASNENDERDKYVQAIRELIKNMTGQLDDKQINNMSPDKLQEIIYGLSIPTGFSKRTLNEIQDKSRVKRMEFTSIMQKFVRQYNRLKEIFDGDYRYKSELGADYGEYKNKNIYYWIPIEELPLMSNE